MSTVGRKYEHTLVNGLEDVTPQEVWVTSCGYSGNAVADASDMVVTVDPQLCTRYEQLQHNIEVKKRQGESGNRTTVFDGSSSGDSGLDEVETFVESVPSWADAMIAIKFDHRKLVVLDGEELLSALGQRKHPMVNDQHTLTLLEPRLTDSENISMRKPCLENWKSATASHADEIVLATELGLPLEDNGDESN